MEQNLSQQPRKLVTKTTLAVDAVLVVLFFIFMYSVTSTHVPSTDPRMKVFFGVYTTICMTLVFWLAVQMFRVVVVHQRKLRQAAAK
ncbi:MAG TPA: hypothetical protein VGG34_04835 [Opitutaceae bacterium]